MTCIEWYVCLVCGNTTRSARLRAAAAAVCTAGRWSGVSSLRPYQAHLDRHPLLQALGMEEVVAGCDGVVPARVEVEQRPVRGVGVRVDILHADGARRLGGQLARASALERVLGIRSG
jgi:hypothetical protein